MHVERFDTAQTYEPEKNWRRVALAGSEAFTFEWFEKSRGHASPMHDHENEQVCIVIEGELTLHSEAADSVTLEKYDSAWLKPWETHSVENIGETTAIGLDVFAPGRSFDFWTDRD